MRRPSSVRVALALAAILTAAALAGCAIKPEPEHMEGRQLNIGGLQYTVFITRELNLRDPEDRAYYRGKAAPPGSALYGVFLRVCNDGDRPMTATGDMEMRDAEDHVFKPKPLSARNPFAYQAGVVQPNDCIPARASPAEYGPTGGAMQLYEVPLTDTENRPIELEIRAPSGAPSGEPQQATVTLDF